MRITKRELMDDLVLLRMLELLKGMSDAYGELVCKCIGLRKNYIKNTI